MYLNASLFENVFITDIKLKEYANLYRKRPRSEMPDFFLSKNSFSTNFLSSFRVLPKNVKTKDRSLTVLNLLKSEYITLMQSREKSSGRLPAMLKLIFSPGERCLKIFFISERVILPTSGNYTNSEFSSNRLVCINPGIIITGDSTAIALS